MHSHEIWNAQADGHGVLYGVDLKRIREARGMSPDEVAERAGILLPSYYDLENCAGEISMGLRLDELAKLAGILGVPVVQLFGVDNWTEGSVSLEEMCQKVSENLSAGKLPAHAYMEKIGFDISAALRDSTQAWERNVDCLRSVCCEIGVDWRAVLHGLSAMTSPI